MKKRYARILAATLSAAMVFTSAPTAVFATELSVSEDAVEAEGIQPSDISALFPDVQVKYGKSSLYTGSAESDTWTPCAVGETVDTVQPDGSTECSMTWSADRDLATVLPGKTVDIKLSIDVTSVEAGAFDGLENETSFKYDKTGKTISKTVTATCVLDDVTYTKASFTGSGKEPTSIAYVYGADDATCTAGSEWKYVGIASGLKTASTKSEFEKAVKFESKKEIDGSRYDTDKLVKALNKDCATWDTNKKVVYSYANKKLYAEVSVKPTEKTILCKEVVWPTVPTIAYGTDLTKVKLADGCGGEFKITGYNTDYDAAKAGTSLGTTVNSTGDIYVIVQFENKDENVTVEANAATSPDGTVVSDGTYYKKVIEASVAKVTLTDADVKIIPKKASFDFGATYGSVGTTNIQTNKYVTYALTDEFAAKAAQQMPAGKVVVSYKVSLKDDTKYVFADGTKDDKVVKVTYDVKAPEISAQMKYSGNTVAAVVDYAKSTTAKTFEASITNIANTVASYQWYKNGSPIADATAETYDVDISANGSNTYYCEVKLKADPSATVAQREAAESAIGSGVYKTATSKVNVSDKVLEFTLSDTDSTDDTYGDIDTVVDSFAVVDYCEDSVNAYVLAEDGTKTSFKVSQVFNTGTTYTLASTTNALPTTLKPGKYTVVIEAKVTDKKTPIRGSAYYEVKKGDLKAAGNITTMSTTPKVKAELDKASYVYGTKTSDMKLVYTNNFGTFKISNDNPEYIDVSNAATVKITFVPSEATKALYDTVDTVKFDDLSDYSLTTKITAAPLTVTGKTIELTVGDKLPTAAATATGFVANDTAEKLGVCAVAEYANGTEDKIAAVGTYKDAVIPKLVNNLGDALIIGAVLSNYDVTFVKGDVVVKEAAAPTTPPTVAPTPAPVKQATAAAPKAAKAKVSVKAGKKYTLKLKYAAGKKSTVKKVKWTSSKKSVATVSSKGKVTAKKAGKATIYARVYFKDGSMKKVKFTVTVK